MWIETDKGGLFRPWSKQRMAVSESGEVIHKPDKAASQ